MQIKNIESTNKKLRPPIVTIMGHVDHGKTSILDFIRKSNVTSQEHGGITQHIGSYQISYKDKKITFIDTPGHAAFSQMRSRGGKVADIVVLVVAADDGVMPQTKEAISHIKAADVNVIVAFNKIDLEDADIKKAKHQLAQENVLVEDWGGDIISNEISAKTGYGIDKLLDSIIAVSELMSLNADTQSEVEAIVIEAKTDKKKGVVVNAIVRSGILKVGDEISASGIEAKVKSLMDDSGKLIKQALPSTPVEILGFKKVPNVGDLIVEKGSDLTELSINEDRIEIIGKETKKTVTIILRADTQGTLEAVKASLAQLISQAITTTFSLKFLHVSTGDVNDSDIMLASNTNALIVGFNVKIPVAVQELSEIKNVTVKVYKTIYELIDEVKDILEGVASHEEQKIKGRAYVSKLFKLESGNIIAGCMVTAGVLKTGKKVAVYSKDPADLQKNDEALYIGTIKKLKKGKDDTDLVGKNNECGVLLKPQFEDIKLGMYIEIL